ncbi:MAG: DUF21 domain-containing protein [Bacteroidales bacterium]|nr:DUF21 domain-containing protein [Bacteroidales bacterium]
MVLLLFYLFLALVISFVCSITEAVLLSTPQPFLLAKQESGIYWAQKFIIYKTNINKPLSAILSLNTVAHTVGAAGVGAQAVSIFGESYFGIVSGILTLLILIVTEIIPKTIGAKMWRNLAKSTYFVISFMIFLTYPLVVMSTFITSLISDDKTTFSTSRAEISALASIGANEGVFSESEHKIIQNLLKLKNVKVSEVMTPRVVMVVADESLLLDDFLKSKDYLRFSRIPVYSGNDENITGYVLRQTVLEKLAIDEHQLKLSDIKRNIVSVPNTNLLFKVWEKLLDSKEHIAIIFDEYGGVDGIVTMEDIIETLLGLEIMDEKDTIVDMQKYARDRWKSRQAKYDFIDKLNKDNTDK